MWFLEDHCTHALKVSFAFHWMEARGVRGRQEEEVNQGDSALDPSVRDHYASRSQWQDRVPGILQLTLHPFASDFCLKGRTEKAKTGSYYKNLSSLLFKSFRKELW